LWPESLHWNWSRKAEELTLFATEGKAIDYESEWQGAMLFDTSSHAGKLTGQEKKPILYIEYVEVAPWNWRIKEIGQERRFRGIGELLLREAIEKSMELGFNGRIGLHALPQAEGFYKSVLNMTLLGRDSEYQQLTYFELSEANAKRYLNKESGQ
jgi:hypothetical protein